MDLTRERKVFFVKQILKLCSDDESSSSSSSSSSGSDDGEKSSNAENNHVDNDVDDPFANFPGITEAGLANAHNGFGITHMANLCAMTETEVNGEKRLINRGGVGRNAEDIPDEFLFHLFHTTFSLWICAGAALDRKGNPKYHEIALNEDYRAKADMGRITLRFFAQALDSFEFSDFDDTGPYWNAGAPRVVYVTAWLAVQRGDFVTDVLTRRDSALALYVSLYGIANRGMCICCTRKYMTRITDGGDNHLSPFSSCVSHFRVRSGACNNCIWDSRDDCSWRNLNGTVPYYRPQYLPGLPPFGVMDRFVKDVNFINESGNLNHGSCPRITCKLTNLETDPEIRAAALEEALNRLAEVEAESD
ncbi:hypothetical protein B0J13DRAFT_624635 [Dactylonectria estremocensis]|uniref:Uncharacterized protein n=1 Tax=Dactylonectria estremocensis TaxID=1079267 RepID=A0A9P9IXX2_9HYPO|nr:hypothetical protein B0J13DRAFT_624635 [Dactylonectria estremocensis]